MEFKQIVQDATNYPSSRYLTLSQFNGLNTNKKSLPSKEEEVLLIFDVSFVEEHETMISIPEPQHLQVSFKHGFKSTGKLSCRRDCTYTFKFPEEIKVEDLTVQWTEDDFLVIKEQAKVEKGDGPDKETTVEHESKGQAKSTENIKIEISNVSAEIKEDNKNSDELSSQDIAKRDVPLGVEESEQSEVEFERCAKPGNVPRLIPRRVGKIYKPTLSVAELKSAILDIENRMLFVKNFMDNYSFDTTCEQSAAAQIGTKSKE